jgi:hypothetical protein
MSEAKSEKEATESRPAETIEMPRSTVWPLVLSVGIALLMVGIATNLVFSVVGLVLLFVGLGGWIGELRPHHGEERIPIVDVPPIEFAGPAKVEGVRRARLRLPTTIHPISAGVRGGIVGGLLMPIPAAAWSIWAGHGIWYPINLLAGLVMPDLTDLSAANLEQFHPTYLVIGIIIHVLMSLVIGLVYGVLLPTLPSNNVGIIIAGGIVLPMIWTGLCHGWMGIVNPLLADRVEWPWFVVSQVVFGLGASITVILSERVAVPPAEGDA